MDQRENSINSISLAVFDDCDNNSWNLPLKTFPIGYISILFYQTNDVKYRPICSHRCGFRFSSGV